ncbi:hypothetical protein [Cognatishimia activa]|uniref:Uncharacterized protein n=1 Tax=Cognatishimia activa TaxID=1715691 RepID=A0A0P1IMW8_9RHOB|nr:hypothetical protein [Cognatishimia activa]CUJ14299.1 hypothetical protein TA5113_02428 [Cognatishimia activa]CUK24991.1 hypothetical protein TA5114_00780 [Cognatishimia activa]
MKYFLTGTIAIGVMVCIWVQGAESEPEPLAGHLKSQGGSLQFQLSVDGPALFYLKKNASRHVLWRVNCALPMRGCVAKATGLVLSINNSGQAVLFAAKPRKARVSLQVKNYTYDSLGLLSAPLTEEQISRLSGPKSFVVIESGTEVILRTPTQGIVEVISYLRWMNTPLARTLRDARLWPDHQAEEFNKDRLSLESREHFEVLKRRHAAVPNRQSVLVPVTKPQIEFAIGAQKGNSFFSKSGHAGY